VTALDRWLLEPAPPERLAALRMLVVGYAAVFLALQWSTLWHLDALPTRQFEPVGVLWWMHSPMGSPTLHIIMVVLAVVTIGALVGWRWAITGPLFAVLFTIVTTYNLSFGHVRHTEHVVLGHVVVLALSPAADVWALGHRGPVSRREPQARFGWPVKVMAIITVLSYTLAGIAKLRYGGWDWLTGASLRNQVAYDNLRKALLGAPYAHLGGWAVGHGWLFAPMAVGSLAAELGAVLALFGGRLRTAWVVAAWAFHIGVVALMWIVFPYQLSGVAYAPLLQPERAVSVCRRWNARRSSSRKVAPQVA
jgi:Vitamin K-dependent gamma-carboxylase